MSGLIEAACPSNITQIQINKVKVTCMRLYPTNEEHWLQTSSFRFSKHTRAGHFKPQSTPAALKQVISGLKKSFSASSTAFRKIINFLNFRSSLIPIASCPCGSHFHGLVVSIDSIPCMFTKKALGVFLVFGT